MRDGEAEPTRSICRSAETAAAAGDEACESASHFCVDSAHIQDPELRAAFMAAHFAWGKAKAPGLMREWMA